MCSRNRRKIGEKILNESNYFHPNISNKILSIKNKSQNKADVGQFSFRINTISQSISEKENKFSVS